MKRIRTWILCLLFCSVFLFGCRAARPDITATPLNGLAEVSDPVTPTALQSSPEPLPTVTHTPQPGLAVLLAPPGADPDLASRLFEELEPRFTEPGFLLETRSSLSTEDLAGADIRLVLALPPDPGLTSLAAASPQTQFMAVGIPNLQPGPNLSLVGPDGLRTDRQGFIAGVIAAMITLDWRVGVISQAEPVQALQARQGFINGAVFFCGLCLPYHGPTNVDYPVYWDLPAGAALTEVQAALQGLGNLAVTTVYLPPGVLSSELAAALSETDFQVIGSTPPPAELADQWVASIQADPLPVIFDLLPTLLEGQGGHSYPLDITLLHINSELFSPGRQARALEILAELQAGYIDPGMDLLEP